MLGRMNGPRSDGDAMLPRARSLPTRVPDPRLTLRRVAMAELALLALGVGWLMVVAPPWAGFGLAVAAAFSWCRWLERYPGLTEPGPDPNGGIPTPVGVGASIDLVASSERSRQQAAPKAA
jgi:hypothetical protein